MDSLASRAPQRAAQGEAMNRLDEIERLAQLEYPEICDFPTQSEVLALVAVARAAADHLRNMDSGDKLAAALAPLLADREG
jgi:hypothetical protein